MAHNSKLAILGTGNLGIAIARGLVRSQCMAAQDVLLTRRHPERLREMVEAGFEVLADNAEAVRRAELILLAVQPQQLDRLLAEIRTALRSDQHRLISVVSGVTTESILQQVDVKLPVVRAMPNVAVAVGQSMTCLSVDASLEDGLRDEVLQQAQAIFDAVGTTLVIDEEQMVPATSLCACGVAFFLRAVRAASQGGIEIGFHPDEALAMAAQTALGAAKLMQQSSRHPEREIDTVTTPRGCTIAGLNEMEHRGFSSAFIKGIVTAASKAGRLYDDSEAG